MSSSLSSWRASLSEGCLQALISMSSRIYGANSAPSGRSRSQRPRAAPCYLQDHMLSKMVVLHNPGDYSVTPIRLSWPQHGPKSKIPGTVKFLD